MKLLLDTNIAIALEDPTPVSAAAAAFAEGCEKHNVIRYVADPNYMDVARDTDLVRREVTLSKLNKFPRLRGVALPSDDELADRFGKARKGNDKRDIHFLGILDRGVVDLLISEDAGLKARAERAGIGTRVLDISEALAWLRQTYEPLSIELPYIEDVPAYQLNLKDEIFDSLRASYDDFDGWFQRKCIAEHRDCWVVNLDSRLAGLVIRKEEPADDADCVAKDGKILKISTFKMSPDFHGEKFGEQLLKKILWWSQTNKYDTVYLTAYDEHATLVELLQRYGFRISKTLDDGELVIERQLYHDQLPEKDEDVDTLEYSRSIYPRYYDGADAKKFVIPIKPEFHAVLFPEIADPIVPEQEQLSLLAELEEATENRTPGNTIRKVYVCRASTQKIRPSDLVFFYATKDPMYARSQSITSIGVVEAVHEARSLDELVQLTAKRSVYTIEQLTNMAPASGRPVKVIDFLLVTHFHSAVPLVSLCDKKVFSKHPPQSITELIPERYETLKALIDKHLFQPSGSRLA